MEHSEAKAEKRKMKAIQLRLLKPYKISLFKKIL